MMYQGEISKKLNITLKLNPKQVEIHKGLKSIGEEIAAFYLDGIKVFNSSELEIKSYLLAHIAREIEGGLRDILVVREKKEEPKCQNCNQIIKRDENNHIAEICIALNVDESNPLAKKWHEVARKFHKFAHRHGAWKEPRDPSEVEKLWNEFENILFSLVGKYFDLLSLVDRILKYEKPSKEILETLSNLLQVKARFSYFFRSLNSIHWLKPLREKGYFNPENNPKPQEAPDNPGYYTIPHWSVLDYLENVANKNTKEPNDEITNTLIEIVNSIINYRDENGERIENYTTDWFILKIIPTFPIERIEEHHIEFIRGALKSKWDMMLVSTEVGKTLLPKFLEHKAKEHALKLFDVILDYKKVRVAFTDEYKSIMHDYWLYQILKKYKLNIAGLCGLEAAEVAIGKIKSIIYEDNSQFDYIWIPTIEDHPQKRFPDRYEIQLVDFVRDYFEISSPKVIRQKVEDLLKEDHPIFKRIAIHTINFHYNELNDLFWNWTDNPLSESFLKHESYELLKKNCSSFSTEQLDKALEWIDNKDFHLKEDIEKDRKQRLEAFGKRVWLTALSELTNPKVIEMQNKYEKIDNAKVEHPGFYAWSESYTGDVSPISTEELIKKTNSEIAEYLKSFEETGGWRQPSKEGLSAIFRKCVIENPEKFSSDLEYFIEVPRVYQHSLIWGLLDAWREKKIFNWDDILRFVSEIIKSEGFWKEENTSPYNYRDWMIPTFNLQVQPVDKNF